MSRVLVVEDNLCQRRFFCRALTEAGHDVCAASSAGEARKMIEAGDFDLVLTDLCLETEDAGLELLASVRKDPSKHHIFFVTLTGREQSFDDLARTLKLGAADCLTKPVSLDIIKAKVGQLLANAPRRDKPAKPPMPADPANTILVVDDDDDYRTVIETGFRQAGFTTRTTTRGKAAVSLARELKPAAMILDFGLPDSTGLEVVRALKNDPETSGILILLLTGNDAKGRAVTCLDDGADGYLVKGACPVEGVVAHARALLRVRQAPLITQLTVGPVILDMKNQKVRVDDGPGKKLTPKEFDLLALLMGRTPEIIGWEVLGERICDSPMHCAFKAKETMRVHLCHLKHKLGPKGAAYLVTHKQQGLQFSLPAEHPQKTASDESLPQR